MRNFEFHVWNLKLSPGTCSDDPDIAYASKARLPVHCVVIRRPYHSLDGVRERSEWASFRYLEPNSVFGGKIKSLFGES